MKTIKTEKTWDWNDVRSMCIRNNWYDRGSNEEYQKMLDMTELPVTDENIYRMAVDIVSHTSAEQTIGNVMYYIGEDVIHTFYDVEENEEVSEPKKVKDLLGLELDIDVYDNVCEELGIAFCGPVNLTEAGYAEFADVLEFDLDSVNLDEYSGTAIVDVDGDEGVWQEKLARAKKFFYSAAGYCPADEYDKWFMMEVE